MLRFVKPLSPCLNRAVLPGKYRPACRITHTGTRSTGSPRAARKTESFFKGGKFLFEYKKSVILSMLWSFGEFSSSLCKILHNSRFMGTRRLTNLGFLWFRGESVIKGWREGQELKKKKRYRSQAEGNKGISVTGRNCSKLRNVNNLPSTGWGYSSYYKPMKFKNASYRGYIVCTLFSKLITPVPFRKKMA